MHSKGNHKENEQQPIERETIFAKNWPTTKFTLQNIQIAHAALCQKQNNPVEKWAEDLNRHLSEEDTDSQKAHEKMLNIANY